MLSDWESDLTELSESDGLDEEEYVPPSQRKRTKTKDTGADYKVSNALRPPRTTQYTARSLFDQIVDNTIDLDPEYQRGVVWPDSKQAGLIDSILRNYYIPPVIFAVTAKEDGSETRTCIDGKQRLTSIANFFNGVICHRDAKTNTKYWYKESGARGPKRKILPRQYQQVFANKQITCVEYECITDDQEREIFQRVQLGVALTPAERLQALTGLRATLVRQIQSKVLGEQGFGNDLEWANGRGRDFQCLASIVYLIEQQPPSFPHITQLEKWTQSVAPLPVRFETDIMETFQIWVSMVRDKQYNMPFSKPTRVSPIEFTIIGVLIHRSRATLSMAQLSSAISHMRADVRSHHQDIRANPKVTKTMFKFINTKLKTIELKGDGKGDVPAIVTLKSNKSGENGAKASKRKRPVETSSEESNDSDDEDEVPLRRKPPTKKKTATPKTTAPKPSTSSKAATTASSSRTTTSKTTIKLPAAKAAPSKSSASASTSKSATSNSKVTVKQVTVAATRSSKSSPAVSRKKDASAASPANGTPVATPTIPSATPAVAKVKASASGSSASSPAPLALPRRTPAAVSVKTEPAPESALPSPAVTRPEGIASSSDRLAVVRKAKANVGGRSISSGSPVVPTTGQSITAGGRPRTSPPNVLDNMAPIIKQERPQLPCIDTNIANAQQQISAVHTAPPSSSSSRLPTPALPPPSALRNSTPSTPPVSTPTPGPSAPPPQIQQPNGLTDQARPGESQIDPAAIEALLREHHIGTFSNEPSQQQPQWKLVLPAPAPNRPPTEDVEMKDETSRSGSASLQMNEEQMRAVINAIPPNVISAIQMAQQGASIPPSPNPGVSGAHPPPAPVCEEQTVTMETQHQNEPFKRSPSTPAPGRPPTMPAAMRTPPPSRPPLQAVSEASTSAPPPSSHPQHPLTLPPPPPSLPPPPIPPVSPTLSVKSASSSHIMARPMSNGSMSPKNSASRSRVWDDRDNDWDMDRGRDRDRDREWSRERDRDRDWDSRSWASDRTRDPRRRNSGGMRDWEGERYEREYDRDRDRSWRGRGRGRGRGWSRGGW